MRAQARKGTVDAVRAPEACTQERTQDSSSVPAAARGGEAVGVWTRQRYAPFLNLPVRAASGREGAAGGP